MKRILFALVFLALALGLLCGCGAKKVTAAEYGVTGYEYGVTGYEYGVTGYEYGLTGYEYGLGGEAGYGYGFIAGPSAEPGHAAPIRG